MCTITQVDVSQQDLLLFLINDGGCHWTLLVCLYSMYGPPFISSSGNSQVVDIKIQRAEYYDSLYNNNTSYWSHIRYKNVSFQTCIGTSMFAVATALT